MSDSLDSITVSLLGDETLESEAELVACDKEDYQTYTDDRLACIVEIVLLTATFPISFIAILNLFDRQISEDRLHIIFQLLQEKCSNSGFELVEVRKGWRFQTRPGYRRYIEKIHPVTLPRYSRAVWETLAVITYKQPVTRGDIEEIRGVAVSSAIIKALQLRSWIEVVGRRDVPGHPALYATTSQFMSDFSIKSLDCLPKLEEFGYFLEGLHDVSSEKTHA